MHFRKPTFSVLTKGYIIESALLRAVASCYYWERLFTSVEKVHWLPDPPFDDRAFYQYWQIVVRGLQPEDTIRVEDTEGLTVMTASPSRAGVAHITLLFPSIRASTELSLELSSRTREEGQIREMSVQQVQFEYRARLPVLGALSILRFEGNTRNRRLVIVDTDQEMTWDVTVPFAPALLRTTARTIDEESHYQVIQNGRRIGAQPTSNLLKALARMQDESASLEAVGSPRVGGITETLYIRTKERARLFDISNPEEPRELHIYEHEAWFEGIALGGNLMAKHNPDTNTIDIYAATISKIM